MSVEMYPGDEELNQLFHSAKKKSEEIASDKTERELKRWNYLWAISQLQDINQSDKLINSKLEELNKDKESEKTKLKQIDGEVVSKRVVEKKAVHKETVGMPLMFEPYEPILMEPPFNAPVGSFKGVVSAFIIFFVCIMVTCVVWAPRVAATIYLTDTQGWEWIIVIGVIFAVIFAFLLQSVVDGLKLSDVFKNLIYPAMSLWKLLRLIAALAYFIVGNIYAIIVAIRKKVFSPKIPGWVEAGDIGIGLIGTWFATIIYVTVRFSFLQYFFGKYSYAGLAVSVIVLFFYWGTILSLFYKKISISRLLGEHGILAAIRSYSKRRKYLREYEKQKQELKEKYEREMEEYPAKLAEYERKYQLAKDEFNKQSEEAEKRYLAKCEEAQKNYMAESEQAENEYQEKIAAKAKLIDRQNKVIEKIIEQINCQEYEKKRNISKRVAITTHDAFTPLKVFQDNKMALESFYDSLKTYRCDCLAGREGAINTYQEDLRSAKGLNPN